MFVPPENDLSSVAFKAGWSICMPLFLKILVQSFTPCFLVFFILLSAPGYRKIFLPLCLLMFQHICSHTRHLSYFLWFFFPKVIFSAISLIFYSTILFFSHFPVRKVGMKQQARRRRVVVSPSRQNSLFLFLGVSEAGRKTCPTQQPLLHSLFSCNNIRDGGIN